MLNLEAAAYIKDLIEEDCLIMLKVIQKNIWEKTSRNFYINNSKVYWRVSLYIWESRYYSLSKK